MRRTLLAATVAVLLAPPSARATGIDLNWNTCWSSFSFNRQADMSFACDNNSAGPFQLFGSVRTGGAVTGITGWAADLDFVSTTFRLEDWWQMGAGECREGGIGFVYRSADMPNVTSCNTTLMDTAPTCVSVYFHTFGSCSHYRIGVDGAGGVSSFGGY